MKTALFITGYYPFCRGGAEYQAYLLAKRLKKTVKVCFAFRNHYDKPPVSEADGFGLYAIRPYPVNRLDDIFIREMPRLSRIMAKVKPDIIYIRGGNAFGAAAAHHARKKGIKTIWHIAHDRDLIPPDPKLLLSNPVGFSHKKIIEYGLVHSDTIIAQTRHQSDNLWKHYRRRCDSIIPNWHPVPPPPAAKGASPLKVVWIANFRPFKQPQIFIRLKEALGGQSDACFIMIGRNTAYPDLVTAAQKAGIDTRGELSNHAVNTLLAESHLLINTSQMEGFSNTFIQAWIRNVPVLSLGADPDHILARGKIGRCANGDFNRLVQDTRDLLIHPALCREMGQRAREHAILHHSLANLEKILPYFR